MPCYWVRTWDAELQEFTPQEGVPAGPYSLWGLKRALQALRRLGYDVSRGAPAVLVEREDIAKQIREILGEQEPCQYGL